ncbi:sensor histidine kinase [Sphingobacterium sp. HSC-15S19]|uniref:sensor histidine kinase n=1 Tax=Sphingobacterium TaxID=28453 RepID=UPI003D1EE97E
MGYNNLGLDPKLIAFIVNDRYRVFRHLALLASFFIILFFSNWLEAYEGIYKFSRLFYVMFIFMGLFYANMYVLVPYLFFKGKYIMYILVLIMIVKAGIGFASYLISHYPTLFIQARKIHEIDTQTGPVEGTIIAVPIILITTTIKLFQRWVKDNQNIAELKNVTLSMELNTLKNQINPHFLFNMLNGIKALVRTNPDKANTVIMRLSEFLRYQLYENNEERTTLGSEIKFLSNFLSLEKLRRDNLQASIVFTSPEQGVRGIMLPPNLFTTFVENAVKHSTTIEEEHATILIEIGIVEDSLTFRCINSVDPLYIPAKNNCGLGLKNISRRLQLLFGNSFHLEMISSQNEYSVSLILKI